MLSVKTKEHIRRRVFGAAPKWGALAGGLAALGCMVVFTGALVRVVTISDSDGQKGTVITAAQEMDTLFRQTGVAPGGNGDELVVAEGTDADNIHILRAYTVNVKADGATTGAVVTGGTVADALKKAGTVLGEDDRVTPGLTELTGEGMTVTVNRVRYTDRQEEQEIPATTEYRQSSLFYRDKDYSETLRTGSAGRELVSYRDTYVDGVLTDTTDISRTVLTAMVPTIIKCYGEGAPVSSFVGPEIVDGKPVEGVAATYSGQRATGYSASLTAKGASGRRLTYGTVAINPGVIPYGSLMYITSEDGSLVYGYAYAADTGTAMMVGNAFIDLYYETYDEAVRNAVVGVNVYVLDADTAARYEEQNDALLTADLAAGNSQHGE